MRTEPACEYRGLDRLPPWTDADLVSLAHHLHLVDQDWASTDETAASRLMDQMVPIRPDWSFELVAGIAVGRGMEKPDVSPEGPTDTFLGYDVASASSPYYSAIRDVACGEEPNLKPKPALNKAGLVESIELAEQFREQANSRLVDEWDRGRLVIWQVFATQTSVSI